MTMINLIYCCVVILACKSWLAAAQEETSALQVSALVDFFNATGGPGWTTNDNWNVSAVGAANVSTWYGLVVNESTGDVVELDVGRNGLVGRLPSTFGNLEHIQYLTLNNNDLTGPLPTEIVSMTGLLDLNLKFTDYTGTIPSSYGLMTKLTQFGLIFTPVSGTLPSEMGNYVNIAKIVLQGNSLTGSIPDTFTAFTAITSFMCYGNDLTGPLPSFPLASALYYLHMIENHFTGTIPENYGHHVGLEFLRLGENDLTGTFPSSLSNLTALYILDVRYNSISGTIPTGFGQLGALYAFLALDNSLTGIVPSEIGLCTNLETLQLGYNDFADQTLPSSLCDLPNLFRLNILNLTVCYPPCVTDAVETGTGGVMGDRCHAEEDIAICSLLNSTDLITKQRTSFTQESLYIESPHPYNDVFELNETVSIPGASNYTVLVHEWTDRFFQSLQICLDASCNEVVASAGGLKPWDQGAVPGSEFQVSASQFYIVGYGIKGPTRFRQFRGRPNGCNSSYFGIDCWGYRFQVTSVSYDDVWECGAPPIERYALENIESRYRLPNSTSYAFDYCNWNGISCESGVVIALDVGSYGISGSMSDELFLMTRLQRLDLSNNKITGSLSDKISTLKDLTQLKLQYNSFTGDIPASLAIVSPYGSSASVDISHNAFTGKLGANLCDLADSSVQIDSSFNDLDCFEACWEGAVSSGSAVTDVAECAPTSVPTSVPTEKLPSSQNFSKIHLFVTLPISVGLCLIIGFIAFKYGALKTRYRVNKTLANLPVHAAILQHMPEDVIYKAVEEYPYTLCELDYYNHHAYDLAMKMGLSDDLKFEILTYLLPIYGNKEMVEEHLHQNAWMEVVQNDENAEIVARIMETNFDIAPQLASVRDKLGRTALNIAGVKCEQAMREALLFLKRYDFDKDEPVHQSETSVLYVGLDSHYKNQRVALKFFHDEGQYRREVSVRATHALDSGYVIMINDCYEEATCHDLPHQLKRWALQEYPYCIVMPAAEKSLANIILTEHFAGINMSVVRRTCTEIAEALKSIHDVGLVHGDVKPLNIMRMDRKMVMIDLDASANVGKDPACGKFSLAYLPPEVIYMKSDEEAAVRTHVADPENPEIRKPLSDDYELVMAHPSLDVWSLGMVFYELCAGVKFFLADTNDSIDKDDLIDLHSFGQSFKRKRLKKIADVQARNMVSQMISKNIDKRPDISHVLAHPFLTGKAAPRMVGERSAFDVFISYRVKSDSHIAEMLYDLLTENGFKVWWDQKCLEPGTSWEEGFCDGLVKSRIFLPILSRGAINAKEDVRSNFSCLTAESPMDSFLLEQQMALELQSRTLIEKIYPVMMGDEAVDPETGHAVYGNYFADGCHPSMPQGVIVESITSKVDEHLNRLSLGTPLHDNMTTDNVLKDITKNQGRLVTGPLKDCTSLILIDLKKMRDQAEEADDSTRKPSKAMLLLSGSSKYDSSQQSPDSPNCKRSDAHKLRSDLSFKSMSDKSSHYSFLSISPMNSNKTFKNAFSMNTRKSECSIDSASERGSEVSQRKRRFRRPTLISMVPSRLYTMPRFAASAFMSRESKNGHRPLDSTDIEVRPSNSSERFDSLEEAPETRPSRTRSDNKEDDCIGEEGDEGEDHVFGRRYSKGAEKALENDLRDSFGGRKVAKRHSII